MTESDRSLTLIDTARRAGVLSEESLKALKKVAPGKLALGSPVNQYKEDHVLLVATLIDDSGSLGIAVEKDPKTGKLVSRSASYDDPKSNAEAVRIGHNAVIEALQDSARPSTIWCHTRYLNGRELNPWTQLEKANKMDQNNYKCGGGTPLYDETVTILGSIVAKSQDFRNKWVKVRTATLLVTDGDDRDSRLQTSSTVRDIVTDMYNAGIHIIAAMGIYDGTTDFKKIFIEMGIRENLILTPGSTPEEIRKAFGLFGKMASRATDLEHFKDIVEQGFLALPPGER